MGILIVYLILVLILAGFLWLTIPVLVMQIRALVAQINAWYPQVSNWLSQLGYDPGTLIGALTSVTTKVGSLVFSLPGIILSFWFDFILILFISVYWLILMNGIKAFFLSFFPRAERAALQDRLSHIGQAMGGYLRGAAIDGLIYGIIKGIGLYFIGVPFALTLGMFAAVMELFPTIGAFISAAVASLVALTVSPTLALITLVFTLILQQLENHILVPLVMRSQTSISPLLAVLAVVIGGALGGILGAIVAIPITSAIDVLIREVIAPALRKANHVTENTNE